MTFEVGRSYLHIKRSDRTRSEYSTFTPNMDLLPVSIAPFEKQLRVFVSDVEYSFLDKTQLTRPTTNYWSYVPESTATGGIACWGVRLIFDPIGESNSDKIITQIAVWDGTDTYLSEIDETWSVEDELEDFGGDELDNGAWEEEVFDLDETTEQEFSGSGVQTVSLRFPRVLVISKIGWQSQGSGAANNDYIENMEFQVNVGTPNDPDWQSMGSNLTQAVGNAISHSAGQELQLADYPSPTGLDATNIDTLLLTLSVQAADIGGIIPPVITLSAALADNSDRIVLMRETRQDRPWVKPVGVSNADPEGLMVYFDQLLFIIQDLCELNELSNFFSVGVANFNANDFTGGSQTQSHSLSGESGPFSYSTVELLDTLPGAQLDDRHQIIVESKATTSDVWTVLSYNAAPNDETKYSVDSSAKTITLGDTTSGDLRIRRVTRTDRYWYDPRNGQPGWNSLGINATQRQARMMIEEACYIPQFYAESPLSNSIFPRGWNWFLFVGTREQWTIGGPVWGGGGEVIIFKNNVLQVEGTDYEVEWPNIVWTPSSEPITTDTTSIGVGGGGFGGIAIGGGVDIEETVDGEGPASNGGNEIPHIDFPSLNLPPSCGISIAIGGKSQASLGSGVWEGAFNVSFSQGNSISSEFGSHCLRVEIVVTLANTVSDGGGGFLNQGATQVRYIGKKCDGFAFNNAAAFHDGDLSWTSDEGSGALGCLAPAGAEDGPDIYVLSGCSALVSSQSAPNLRLLDQLLDQGVQQGNTPLNQQIPFFSQWEDLRDQSVDALAAGVVSDSGFSGAQWDEYIDPDETFTDFDIPSP